MKQFSIILIIIALIFPITALGARPKKSSQKKKEAPNPTEVLTQAKTAFYDYKFDKAIELINKYETEIEEFDKQIPTEMQHLLAKAEIGSNMMSRVERIAIIDSITVDKNDFFSHYNLSKPSGYILSSDDLPGDFNSNDSTTVYVTESGETMIWSRKTKDGTDRELIETHRLADGTWEEPIALGEALEGISANYPFLQPDGITLYFAAQGEESLGGYDIFISRNDGDDYLQPQNLGMPYNSPYNDYLLAIDEQTGAGWWATDRKQIKDKVTIYVFVPQELRINYAVDDPNLAKYASVTSIAATLDPQKDYSQIRQAIKSLESEIAAESSNFTIAVPGKGILTHYEQFESPDAQEAMRQQQACIDELNEMEITLDELRRQYATEKSLKDKILKLEIEIDKMRKEIKRLTNEVIRLEIF